MTSSDPCLDAWMRAAGKAVEAELVLRYRLPVTWTRERRGVRRAAWGFDTGGTVLKGDTYRAAVAGVLQVRDAAAVQTFTEYGRLYFSVPFPPAFVDEIDPWKLPAADGWRVCLGINEGDNPVWWDMDAHKHLLIGGPTGTGKSVVMRLIVKGLLASAADFRLVVLGAQPDAWDAAALFRQSWGFHGVADAPAAVDWLMGEYERRKGERVKTPTVLVLVDDLLALLDQHTGTPGLIKPLTTLFVQARHVGFHLVAGVQAATGIDGLGTLVKQTPRRIVTGAGSPDEAFRLAGVAGTGAERLTRGEVVSVADGKATWVYVPRFEDADLGQMRGGAPDPAPWLARNGESGPKRPETGETATGEGPQRPDSRVLTFPRPETAAVSGEPATDDRAERVRQMLRDKRSQGDIITEVWKAKPGAGDGYKQACAEYRDIVARLIGG